MRRKPNKALPMTYWTARLARVRHLTTAKVKLTELDGQPMVEVTGQNGTSLVRPEQFIGRLEQMRETHSRPPKGSHASHQAKLSLF